MSNSDLFEWKYAVVLSNFPLADELGKMKARPVLCLTEPTGKYNEIVIAYITSKIPFHQITTDFTISKDTDWFEITGLAHSSTIRLHKLTTVNTDKITHFFGRLEDRNHKKVSTKS